MESTKLTVDSIRSLKGKRRFAALTTYDYPMTRLLDEAGIPLLLVGDSLGMVVLGYPDTTHVTLAEMIHHVRACARAKPLALLGGDLPYKTYDTPDLALQSAVQLRDAGAEFVKLEGGIEHAPTIRRLVQYGIPVCGHLGMLPQHILEEGKYRIKGKIESERRRLLDDAQALVEAGAFAIVLELVTPPVADEITRALPVPTIGIGSGPNCDAQILVTHDLVGAFPWFTPKFATPQATLGATLRSTAHSWRLKVERSQSDSTNP